MAALVLVLSGGIVVYGPAESATAVPVTINNPLEIVPITDTVWPFDGIANPFETITVQFPGGVGTGCTDVADAGGAWACNVTFAETNQFTQVQAISFNHATPDLPEDTQEYAVTIPPEVDESPLVPGSVVTNVGVNPVVTGIADPLADVEGSIGGLPCADTADAGGVYTCQAAGGLGPDADYAITMSQTPSWGGPLNESADGASNYRLDTVTAIPDFSYPYDTIGPGAIEVTSDRTPLVGGNPGTAESFGTVTVYADPGPLPMWPPTPTDPGSFYCSAVADVNGAWSCSPAFTLPVGDTWVFGSTQDDLAGNTTGSPDAEFSVQILPPPPPPTVLQPVIGYQSQSTRVHVSTSNLPEGVMYVREGGSNLCPSTPVGVSTFSCDTVPLAPGVHVLNVFQEDSYGSLSAPAQRTVTILPPPLPLALKTLSFTFRIMGPDGEVGENGLAAGDEVTIVAEGLPPGTVIEAEIHSTPIGLGSTTIGSAGALAMPVTVPDVEPGEHEIVLAASAPGYAPATIANPVTVHEVKEIPGVEDEVKELGDPDESVDGAGGSGSPAGSAYGFGDPTAFGSSVESPFDAQAQAFQLTVAGVALTGSLGLAFLLLVGLPAELLESTIRSNYGRAFGWLARFRRRVGRLLAPVARLLANPWVGSGLTILAAAVLLGFADPGYGFNGASVRLTLAMILSVLVINVALAAILMRVARQAFDVRAMLQPMPAALALVGISVLVSRLAGISPGFLFGIVLGVTYLRQLRLRDEGRLGALGVILTLAAGLLAWLGYGIASIASGPGFWNNLAIETFAAITLEALGTLVIALLPIDFLDGRTIFRWSKPAWLGLYLATVLVFLFVVVPMSGNWGVMTAPIFGWGTLFVVFGVVAIATWAIFKRLPPRSGDASEATTPSSRPGAEAPPRSRRRSPPR